MDHARQARDVGFDQGDAPDAGGRFGQALFAHLQGESIDQSPQRGLRDTGCVRGTGGSSPTLS